MNFREIRKNLLNISIGDFASEYGVPIGDVERMDHTNEVPIALIRQISKRTGCSVGDLLKYDGSNQFHEKSSDADSHEGDISCFSIAEKESVVSQFNNWFQENKTQLNCSEEVENWTSENIIWVLEEYDKYQQGSVPDNEKTDAKDVRDFSERLAIVSQNEIKRLQFILDDRGRSKDIIWNAINLEVTRRIKQDSILEKTSQELDEIKSKYLKETRELLVKMTSRDYIEKVIDSSLFDDYLSLELKERINKACINKQEEFLNAIDSAVHQEDGLIQFYKNELRNLFANASELNGFSTEDIYKKHFRYAINHPDIFDIKYPEITDAEKAKRSKATGKRHIKEAARDLAIDMVFPPKAIFDVFTAGSKRNIANEKAKQFKEQHQIEEYYNQIAYCYDVYVACAVFSLKGIKSDWKDYFDKTIDIVQKDGRDINRMIVDEKKKILIAKTIKEAFQEE